MPDKILIGWASRDVTPDRPVNLRGQFHARIARKTKDPVSVTALAISSGASKESSLIWVSCDTATIPLEVLEMCRKKTAKLAKGFPVKNLVMNATHTHTAPDLGFDSWYANLPEDVMDPEDYAEFFSGKVAEAAAEAWNKRRRGFVSYGISYAVIGHGRRAIYFDDLSKRPDFQDVPGMKMEKNARMYGDTGDDKFDCIEGYADHSTHFLFTFDSERKLTGAAINIACPSQATEQLCEISADFWHEARKSLRKKYGQGLFILPQTSAAGGLGPHLMFNKKAQERMLRMKQISQREELGRRIRGAFDEAYSWAKKEMCDTPEFAHSVRKLELPRRKVSREEYRKCLGWLKELENTKPTNTYLNQESHLYSRKLRCKQVIDRYENLDSCGGIGMELHTVRIGDIALASNPFELFSDFGIRIQARSPATQTFVVQLCAGPFASYLPSRLAQDGESYSACVFCNLVGPEGGDKLVDETVSDLKSLWKK